MLFSSPVGFTPGEKEKSLRGSSVTKGPKVDFSLFIPIEMLLKIKTSVCPLTHTLKEEEEEIGRIYRLE